MSAGTKCREIPARDLSHNDATAECNISPTLLASSQTLCGTRNPGSGVSQVYWRHVTVEELRKVRMIVSQANE